MAAVLNDVIADDVRISQPDTCKMFGNISPMTLWRWRNNPVMNFPKPIIEVNGRVYFSLVEVRNWRPPKRPDGQEKLRPKAPARRNA
jgi:hypothetical protein